jgi:hypothetical protein
MKRIFANAEPFYPKVEGVQPEGKEETVKMESSELLQRFQQVILDLGNAFLTHPSNEKLRQKFVENHLQAPLYYQQLLRITYRFLFLFTLESRGLWPPPTLAPEKKEEFWKKFSLTSFLFSRDPCSEKQENLFWKKFLSYCDALHHEAFPDYGIEAWGGSLWATQPIHHLIECELEDKALKNALKHLQGEEAQEVFSRRIHLYSLQALYDSLFRVYPEVEKASFSFRLIPYPDLPASLPLCPQVMKSLLDATLEPLIQKVSQESFPEQALLQLKIFDPACGSGSLLVAAAYRISEALEALPHWKTLSFRHTLREVIRSCMYGIDINSFAMDCCKMQLWLESFIPGRPFPFLDLHIQCGNSLIGATPALLQKGIPDEAFLPQEGENPELCFEYLKKNQTERLQPPFTQSTPLPLAEKLESFVTVIASLEKLPEDTFQELQTKQQRYEDVIRSHSYLYRRIWADAWCATFVWEKTRETPPMITESLFKKLYENPYSLTLKTMNEIRRLAKQYRFFHWHLAFPMVFRIPSPSEQDPHNLETGWIGGFDVILSDLPSFFSQPHPVHHFIHSSKKYRTCVCQSTPLERYSIFIENYRSLLKPFGYLACLIPSTLPDPASRLSEFLSPASVLFLKKIPDSSQTLLGLHLSS